MKLQHYTKSMVRRIYAKKHIIFYSNGASGGVSDISILKLQENMQNCGQSIMVLNAILIFQYEQREKCITSYHKELRDPLKAITISQSFKVPGTVTDPYSLL